MAASIVMLEAAIPQRGHAQWHSEVLPGLRFGPPIRAGFALGVTYGAPTGPAPFAGPILIGEGGVSGGRVSAGYLVGGPLGSGLEFLGSAIRTWGSPAQAEKNRTLAGGELRASFFSINLGVGLFRPVSGLRTDRKSRYFLNIGLGI